MANEKGVWRTVRGRRLFIAEGDDLATAMKKSGKFKNLFGRDISDDFGDEDKNIFVNNISEAKREISNQIEKMKKMGIKDNEIEGMIHYTNSNGTPCGSRSWGEKDIKLFAEIYDKDANAPNGVSYITLRDRDKKIGKSISINIDR